MRLDDRAGTRRLEDRPLLRDHPIAVQVALALWAVSALVFAAMAIPGVERVVQWIDDAVYEAMVFLESGPLIAIARALDFLGGAWVTTPIIAAVAIYLLVVRRWEALAFWVSAMVVSQLFIGPVKALYARPRPPASIVSTSGFSFPSGHAVATTTIALALVIVLVPAGSRRRNLELLAVAFSVVMAASRVYLRAHWYSDVAAGVALGAAIAVGIAALVHRFDEARSSGQRRA